MNQRKGSILKVLLVIVMDYSISSTPVVIQGNQIELVEAAKETNTYSFGSITIAVKIFASNTNVKKLDKFGSEKAFDEAAIVALFEFDKTQAFTYS